MKLKLAKYFTKREVRDLLISVMAITFILSFDVYPYPHFNELFPYFLVTISAFLLHELAHKFVALKFNCIAYYRMWPTGLSLGLLMSLLRFKVIAPGFVEIYAYRFGRWGYRFSRLTVIEEGLISLAGPAINLSIAAFLYLLNNPLATFVADVNSWIALFNLLPIPPLDGSKIMKWKAWLWLIMFIIAFLFVTKII